MADRQSPRRYPRQPKLQTSQTFGQSQIAQEQGLDQSASQCSFPLIPHPFVAGFRCSLLSSGEFTNGQQSPPRYLQIIHEQAQRQGAYHNSFNEVTHFSPVAPQNSLLPSNGIINNMRPLPATRPLHLARRGSQAHTAEGNAPSSSLLSQTLPLPPSSPRSIP